MFLTQRVFASVMETVQINVPLLDDFELYEEYLHFFQSYLNCLIFSFLLKKSLKLFFVSQNLKGEPKFKKFQQKMDRV